MDPMRPDTVRAQIVEAGLARLGYGRRVAAAFMAQRGVPDRVICRVLGEPGMRRVAAPCS